MKKTIAIHCRNNFGSDNHVARSEGISASSTMDNQTAAERVAMKIKLGRKDVCNLRFEEHGITMKAVTDFSFLAEWEEVSA